MSRRSACFALVCLWQAVSTDALAEPVRGPEETPAPVATVTGVDAVSAEGVTEERDSEAAREAVLRARVRFDEGDFRGAAVEFERAYVLLLPGTRRHAVLNNLAVCYERMFAYDDALVTYERYLREAAPSASDRGEVERIVRGLRDLLGGLRVDSNVAGARVLIDDDERGRQPVTLRLTAGTHVVELRAPGYRAERRSVLVYPRRMQALRVDMEIERTFLGAHRAYFYGGAVLAAVALATGTGLGARALHEHHAGKASAQKGLATVSDEAHIRRLSVSADIAFGTAALLGVGTFVLAFLTDWGKREARPAPSPNGLALDVAVVGGKGAMVGLSGVL